MLSIIALCLKSGFDVFKQSLEDGDVRGAKNEIEHLINKIRFNQLL